MPHYPNTETNMITRIPNSDPRLAPGVASLVERHASRYEFRLDGSSLWDGRVRSPIYSDELLDRVLAELCVGPTAGERRAWVDEQRIQPQFCPPAGFKRVPGIRINEILQYFQNDTERALIAVQDTDLFIIQHCDKDGYKWELERVKKHSRLGEGFIRPRDLFTGFPFVLAVRSRSIRESSR